MSFQYLSTEFCPLNKSMFAKVVAASRSAVSGTALYTVHARYPRPIHGEVLTHRVMERNGRSSRAVPIKTMLEEVRNDPFVPWHLGKNQRGMVAGESFSPEMIKELQAAWLVARDNAVLSAEGMMDEGVHKQIPNRLLEPFAWIDVLITATDWNNFFHLRDHGDAEPHMQDLARVLEVAIARAEPTLLHPGEWHLPYIVQADWDYATGIYKRFDDAVDFLRRISTARCARISYTPFDGNASYERELERYQGLVTADRVHASPLGHQATPDTRSFCRTFTDFGDGSSETVEGMAFDNADLHGCLRDFIQHRKLIKGEAVYG